MTEGEYLSSADPARVLSEMERLGYGCAIGGEKTPGIARKLRLFACACTELSPALDRHGILAAEFLVHRVTVSRVVRRLIWKHVPDEAESGAA